MFETALAADEIITAVSFPTPEKAAYAKFRNPASRYAIVGVFVAKTGSGVRVAVTGAGPSRLPPEGDGGGAGEIVHARRRPSIKQSDNGLNSDIHASAEYRAHLVTVMASRAVQRLRAE